MDATKLTGGRWRSATKYCWWDSLWQACRLTSNPQGLQKGKQRWDASGAASETVLPREKAGCQKRVGGLSQSPALLCRHLAPTCLKTLSISMTGVVVSMSGLAKLCICL